MVILLKIKTSRPTPNAHQASSDTTRWLPNELREARERGGVMTAEVKGRSRARPAPSGGSEPGAAGERGGVMTGRSEGPLPSKASPLGGQRTRRSRGAWGRHDSLTIRSFGAFVAPGVWM